MPFYHKKLSPPSPQMTEPIILKLGFQNQEHKNPTKEKKKKKKYFLP